MLGIAAALDDDFVAQLDLIGFVLEATQGIRPFALLKVSAGG